MTPGGPVGGAGAGRPPADLLAALRGGRIQGEGARLRAATQLLESTFYQELFKAMRATVPEGGAVSGGQGQEMFESLLDQHVAEASARREGAGLGDALYRWFTREGGAGAEGGSGS